MSYKIKVWDLPTRIFHVLLIFSFFFMIYSGLKGGNIMQWHLKIGILLLILIIFRIIWGIIGSDTAKFKNFIKSPKAIINYIKNGINEDKQPGHNPLGALMIISLIFLIFLQILTGLITNDENSFLYNGYLSSIINNDNIKILARNVHIKLFWIILFFVIIHIIVILCYKHIKNHNLIKPMITGVKYLNTPVKIKIASNTKAVLVLVIIIGVIFSISRYIN